MELPREVRDMIYEACLTSNGAIFVGYGEHDGFEPQQPEDFDRQMPSIDFSATAKARNLFYVSKQIRDEAVAIFYRKNTFELMLIGMERFIRRMRVGDRHNLRSVIVYYEHYGVSNPDSKQPLRALERCVGLRDLTLVICCRCLMYASDGDVLREPPGFNYLLRIRGLDNVRVVMTERAWGVSPGKQEHIPEGLQAMEAALQVLKQPRRVPQKTNRKVVKKRAQKKKRKSAST